MIFCTKSARKIAEFQACIKLGKFYILMFHLPSGPMLGNSVYSFHKCFTVQHAIWLWISLADHCVLVYAICYNHLMNDCFICLLQSASRSRFIHCKVIFSFYRTWVLHTVSEDFRNFPNGKAHFKSFSQKTSVRGNAVLYIVIWFIIFFKHSYQILIHFSFIK